MIPLLNTKKICEARFRSQHRRDGHADATILKMQIHRKVDAAIVLAVLGAATMVVGAWQHSNALGMVVTGLAVTLGGVGIHFWNRMCDEQEAAIRMAQQNPNRE